MWERLYQETTLVSNIHSEYSKKIVEEIEQPLRHCMMNNSDYHKVQSMEESLIKMCKENEDLEFKIQKVNWPIYYLNLTVCIYIYTYTHIYIHIYIYIYSIKKQDPKVNQKQ